MDAPQTEVLRGVVMRDRDNLVANRPQVLIKKRTLIAAVASVRNALIDGTVGLEQDASCA